MHLDQIQLILDLAKTHSFNQTAERHYTTQQSISYSIKQLEKELNTKIFTRSKSGVTFTPEGEYVLQCAQQINDIYQTLLHNLGQEKIKDVPPKKIVLNLSSVLLTNHMPSIIKDFNQLCPTTRLNIKEVSNESIIPSLVNGSCDMAVWSINHRYLEQVISAQDANKISFQLIKHDKSIAVISANSPLAKKTSLTIADISMVPKSIFGLLPIDFFGKNVDASVLYENNNPSIHQQLISENNTICFTSEIMYQRFFPEDKFVALPFDYPVLPNYHMILRRKEAEHTVYDTLEDIIFKQLS